MGSMKEIQRPKRSVDSFDYKPQYSYDQHNCLEAALPESLNNSGSGLGITMIGLCVNMGLAIAKWIGGRIFNSQA